MYQWWFYGCKIVYFYQSASLEKCGDSQQLRASVLLFLPKSSWESMTRVAEVLGLLKPNDVIHGWWGGDWLSCIALLAGHETHEPRRVNTPNLFGKSNLFQTKMKLICETCYICSSYFILLIKSVCLSISSSRHLNIFTAARIL